MEKTDIGLHINRQLYNIMGADINVEKYLETTLELTRNCLKSSPGKYHVNLAGGGVNIYHSVQYMILLYWLSRVMFQKDGSGVNAEKVYYLNKVLHSVDIFYEVNLPAVWCAEHPLGSVMGRAQYGDRFFFYQGCTVGGNKGFYPVLGENVVLYANSKILGDCKIGNYVILAANTYIRDQNIPDNCIVFGQSPNLLIKQKSKREIQELQIADSLWNEIIDG